MTTSGSAAAAGGLFRKSQVTSPVRIIQNFLKTISNVLFPKLRYLLGIAYWFLFACPKPAMAFNYGASMINRVSMGRFGLLKASLMAAVVTFLFFKKKTASHRPFVYGTWRTDIPAEKGYSHELISTDALPSVRQGSKEIERLESEPFSGVNTLYEAIMNNFVKMPDTPILGTVSEPGGDY